MFDITTLIDFNLPNKINYVSPQNNYKSRNSPLIIYSRSKEFEVFSLNGRNLSYRCGSLEI